MFLKINIFPGSLKIVSVSRNPHELILDYILMNSTISVYQIAEKSPKTKFFQYNNETKLYELGFQTFSTAIDTVEKEIDAIHLFLKQFNVKVVQAEDFFTHSKLLLVEMCAWLNLECFDDYKTAIERSLKTVPRQLRKNFFWPPEILRRIDGLLKKYPRYFMEGSDFLIRNV